MFLILQGEGELRFGDERFPIRKHDVIACLPGGPDVAHQIINTGTTTMRYLALSTLVDVETCEYPDSQEILVAAGQRGERSLRKMFRAENTVDYYDRERTGAAGELRYESSAFKTRHLIRYQRSCCDTHRLNESAAA